MPIDHRPILALDFDGVCHSYTSGWINAWTAPDPPVPGLFEFLGQALKTFRVAIYSSRSEFPHGRDCMREWFTVYAIEHFMYVADPDDENSSPHALAKAIVDQLEYPVSKPAAFVTLDDRAITFTGHWPDVAQLKSFRTWNHQLKERRDVK